MKKIYIFSKKLIFLYQFSSKDYLL